MQPFLDIYPDATWIEVKDGDPTGLTLFQRHYSHRPYADGRKPKLYVGPGFKMVLLTPCARALFVWRKFISGDGQQGVNCAVFRNEGAGIASTLILAAEQLVWSRWPGERLFTYVNPRKVKGNPPGNCFRRAGWRPCGITKHRKLLILEKLNEGMALTRAA